MIMYLVVKDSVENLVPMDSDSIKYCEIKQEDHWRLSVVHELTDVKYGEASVVGFSRDELKSYPFGCMHILKQTM